jgi:hypothetical protein
MKKFRIAILNNGIGIWARRKASCGSIGFLDHEDAHPPGSSWIFNQNPVKYSRSFHRSATPNSRYYPGLPHSRIILSFPFKSTISFHFIHPVLMTNFRT